MLYPSRFRHFVFYDIPLSLEVIKQISDKERLKSAARMRTRTSAEVYGRWLSFMGKRLSHTPLNCDVTSRKVNKNNNNALKWPRAVWTAVFALVLSILSVSVLFNRATDSARGQNANKTAS